MIDSLPFPRLKLSNENGLFEQIAHIETEMDEVRDAYCSEPIERVAEEIADMMVSCKTALDIIERTHGIHPLDVMVRVHDKNRRRGYESDQTTLPAL